jgi:hypothetical protein
MIPAAGTGVPQRGAEFQHVEEEWPRIGRWTEIKVRILGGTVHLVEGGGANHARDGRRPASTD